MNLKALAALLLLGSICMVTATGCAAGPAADASSDDATTAPDEETATSVSALKAGGGGGGAGFSCSGLGCICYGDYDCNDMFGSGVCGDMPAKCYERGPGPHYCICAPWVNKMATVGTITATGGPARVLTSP